jgi:hypothetical protein
MTLLHHRLRQARLDPADAVLHLDLRFADLGAGREGDGQVDPAGGLRGRLEIEQAGNAVELLFDGRVTLW